MSTAPRKAFWISSSPASRAIPAKAERRKIPSRTSNGPVHCPFMTITLRFCDVLSRSAEATRVEAPSLQAPAGSRDDGGRQSRDGKEGRPYLALAGRCRHCLCRRTASRRAVRAPHHGIRAFRDHAVAARLVV